MLKDDIGFGDTIDRILRVSGVKRFHNAVAGKGCGKCKDRQNKLNELFPYKKVKDEASDT